MVSSINHHFNLPLHFFFPEKKKTQNGPRSPVIFHGEFCQVSGMMSITTGTVIPTPKEARMRQMISALEETWMFFELGKP